jgi:2-polyprenyl-3-methyl-5-hydroxy-6-metoxy-1,4-benzoquinol methylase
MTRKNTSDITPWASDLDHLQWIKTFAPQLLQAKNILDLGCGSGYVCDFFMSHGAKTAVGIDAIEVKSSAESKAVYYTKDLNDPHWQSSLLSQYPHGFDCICAFDIIEHLLSPALFLRSINDLLSKNGALVLTTPNSNSWERLLKPHTWSGARDPQHLTLFSKYSLGFLLRKCDMQPTLMCAPVRKLGPLSNLFPHIGGQIFTVAQKS